MGPSAGERRNRSLSPQPSGETRGSAAAALPDRVCVGQVGAPHGVRGELRIKPFTADPLAFQNYGPLESEDGARRFTLLSLRPAGSVVVARLEGVADRDAAEALRNARLYVPRERLPPPEENEFYHADLIGLAAVSPEGRPLGTVVAVPNFGAGDLIEVAPADGGASVLVPFTRAVVPEIDLTGRRVVVDAPAEFPE